jgi:hypothetical protein
MLFRYNGPHLDLQAYTEHVHFSLLGFEYNEDKGYGANDPVIPFRFPMCCNTSRSVLADLEYGHVLILERMLIFRTVLVSMKSSSEFFSLPSQQHSKHITKYIHLLSYR